MADVQYSASLDDRQVLAALDNIDRNLVILARSADKHFKGVEHSMTKAGDTGKRAFDDTGKKAKVSGVQIGFVSGVVQELTRRFIQMGEQAARAFLNVVAGGVELNRQAELTKRALTAIFEGNEGAADAFIDRFEGLADKLRADRQEIVALGKSLLPDIGDIQLLEDIMANAVLLGRDAGKNFGEIKRALEEAAAGQFMSLQRILNVPPESVRRIKELSKELGLGAALAQVLSERVVKGGLDIENTYGTLESTIGTLNARATDLNKTLGKPVFEEVKRQAEALLKVLDEHSDEIELVAVAFGDLAAAVVKLIGTRLTDFLEDLDYGQLAQIADDMQRALAAADLFVSSITGAEFSQSLLGGLQQTVRDLQTILITLAQISALSQAEIARRQAEAASLQARGKGLRVGPVVISEADTEAKLAGEEAYNQVMLEQLDLIAEYETRLAELNQRAAERAVTSKAVTEAEQKEGETIVKLKKLREELTAAESDAADAQKKIADETEEAIEAAGQRRLEISIAAERKRLDNEVKNAQEIEDIWRKHYQQLDDAARDLSRDEEDTRRQAVRDEIEIERDAAGERLAAETDYRRELQRIRDRFNQSAAEAERNNDAQAFLEAMRQRDRDIGDARRTRDESLEDAKTRAVEQRAALQEQLAFELEDARIANGRKLEDLQATLQRELEEQAIKAQRAEEARQLEYQQELEDFARKESQKLEELGRSLEKEVASIRTAEQLKREIRVAEAQATVDQVNAIFARLNPFGTSTASRGQYYYRGAEQRQAGGDVASGRPYIVGERGPELFIPDRSGQIVPNAAVGPAMTNVSNVYNNQRSLGPVGVNVSESIFGDPVAVRKMRNMIMSVLVEAL